MSEPEAGSDVGNLSCRAERSNGGYVINGQKTWITARTPPITSCSCAARIAPADKHEGLSMISVPPSVDGLEIRGIETMGGREVNDVFFTDCRVPADRLIGEQDQAWRQLMTGLNHERLIIAAQSLGMAQRAFDDALAYVKERKQFGRPIGSFQTLKHRLADLATEIEATRLLMYDVAARVDAEPRGTLFPREASMAKLKATEVAKRMTLEGDADDGWLRLRGRVRHGAPGPDRAGDDDLRRHQRDPAGDHFSDAGAVGRVRGPPTSAEQAEPHRLRDRGGSIGDAELPVDVGEVGSHRGRAEHQLLGDSRAVEAVGGELEHLSLAAGEGEASANP